MASSPGAPPPFAARVKDPGYTPGIRDLDALLELFSDEDEELARVTERAVLRIEARHRARLVSGTIARLATATRPARGRLARLVGRLATSAPEPAVAEARTWLVSALGDPDPKTRHTAARALGKLTTSDAAQREAVERALLAAWDAARGDDDRRSLADALGKVGSKAARDKLSSGSASPAIAQTATRATLMIDRSAARERPGAIDLGRAMEGPCAIRFHARNGLEEVVSAELGEAWRPRVAGPGLVDARLVGPLGNALEIRTALHVGFPLDPVPVSGELAEAIVRAITAPRALAILRAYTSTDGAPIRFRLAWTRGGHRRALAWRCAELVAAATKEIVNDPTESTWEIVVDDHADRVSIELVPRGFADERFAYRTATVPASSHPTIAAALVRLVPPREDDVVWDPFVGAGAELVERARLGPYASLLGTDVEATALEAARTNLTQAGIAGATLLLADATAHEPRGVTLIVTNPPMGRRVQRGTHGELLERFVDHAARVLVPGGALVWAVPDPRTLNARAERAGLALERAFTVDMGGFPAELSVHRKRGALVSSA
ncbi:MAG: putative N6-adenine-specific methylase containing domain protein [Labilithrix sp.]|nr:putative N6-adenine-specific methylase containing domain protein [Labilithrix sp.]